MLAHNMSQAWEVLSLAAQAQDEKDIVLLSLFAFPEHSIVILSLLRYNGLSRYSLAASHS